MLTKPSLAYVPALTALTLGLLGAPPLFAQPQVEIEYIGGFGGYGKTEPGTFDWPVGIAIDDQGRLVIPDNDNHRVQRCTAQGACEVFGKRGSGLGEFVWPLGVAIDSLGRIIISEAGNDRIQLRSQDGTWTSFGTIGVRVKTPLRKWGRILNSIRPGFAWSGARSSTHRWTILQLDGLDSFASEL